VKKTIAQFADFEKKSPLETLAHLRSHSVQCIFENAPCILQFSGLLEQHFPKKTPWHQKSFNNKHDIISRNSDVRRRRLGVALSSLRRRVWRGTPHFHRPENDRKMR